MTIDIVAVIGLFLSICAIILFFWERTSRRERDVDLIKSKMDLIVDQIERTLEDQREFARKAKELSYSHHLRPELSIFVTKQWDFVEKTFHNRFEKHSICRRIVTNHLSTDASLLLDSGSTVDLLTFELLSSDKNEVNILSNNVFAAMHLVGDKSISFRLLPGLFNDRFAATYSSEALGQILAQDFSAIILATTATSFTAGVMVHNGDKENLAFKKAVLDNFTNSRNTRLIIAADATKFTADKNGHKGVLDEDEWANMISDNASRIVLVTSAPRPEVRDVDRAAFVREISSFRASGVWVDSDSP